MHAAAVAAMLLLTPPPASRPAEKPCPCAAAARMAEAPNLYEAEIGNLREGRALLSAVQERYGELRHYQASWKIEGKHDDAGRPRWREQIDIVVDRDAPQVLVQHKTLRRVDSDWSLHSVYLVSGDAHTIRQVYYSRRWGDDVSSGVQTSEEPLEFETLVDLLLVFPVERHLFLGETPFSGRLRKAKATAFPQEAESAHRMLQITGPEYKTLAVLCVDTRTHFVHSVFYKGARATASPMGSLTESSLEFDALLEELEALVKPEK